MTLPDRLKELRSFKKMTQINMAKILGVATSTYQNYERGDREATESFVKKVVTAFGVSSSWILMGSGPMFLQKDRYVIPEKELSAFGRRLSDVRTQIDKTAEEVAELIDIDAEIYKKWETGEESPERKALTCFAAVFDIDKEWLLSGRGEMSATIQHFHEQLKKVMSILPKNKKLVELAIIFDDLPSHRQDKIVAYAKDMKLLAYVENQINKEFEDLV